MINRTYQESIGLVLGGGEFADDHFMLDLDLGDQETANCKVLDVDDYGFMGLDRSYILSSNDRLIFERFEDSAKNDLGPKDFLFIFGFFEPDQQTRPTASRSDRW